MSSAEPFTPLVRWPPPIEGGDVAAVDHVFRRGRWTRGQCTELVEELMRQLTRAKHAIAFPSCSAAIEAAAHAHSAGCLVEKGDHVIAPSFGFAGTVAGVARAGAKIVFEDLEDETLTMACEHIALGADTELNHADLVIAVDLHGVPHRWPRETVQGVPVINDSCQAIGTFIDAGAGEYEHLGRSGTHCWSFSSAKLIAAPAGGCVTTSEPLVAERLRMIRNYGADNSRPISLNPPKLRAQMNGWPSEVDMAIVAQRLSSIQLLSQRARIAGEYLIAAAVEGGHRTQKFGATDLIAWHKVRVGATAERALRKAGVPVHRWGIPLHRAAGYDADLKVSGYAVSEAAAEMICVGSEDCPPWTWTEDEIDVACEALRRS